MQLPADQVVDRVRELAGRIADAFADAARAADIKELGQALPDLLVDLVADRAKRCLRATR